MNAFVDVKGLSQELSGAWGPFWNEALAHEFAERHGMAQGRAMDGECYTIRFMNPPGMADRVLEAVLIQRGPDENW